MPEPINFHRWIGGDLELRIRVQPGARQTDGGAGSAGDGRRPKAGAWVSGMHGDSLKIRVRARAIEGAANQALLEFLAGELQVPPARCELVSGEKHREKRVLVRAAPRAHCENVLARWAAQGRTSS